MVERSKVHGNGGGEGAVGYWSCRWSFEVPCEDAREGGTLWRKYSDEGGFIVKM